MDMVRQMRAEGRQVNSMAQAAPWYGPPEEALELLAARLGDLSTHCYGPDPGFLSTRIAVAEDLRDRRSIELDHGSELHITCGASQAFLSALIAVTDAGDPALVIDPWYFDHVFAIRFCNLELRVASMEAAHEGWRFPRAAIEKELEEDLRALVLVNPGNPTGCVLTEEELRWLAEATADAGCFLLIDETYERFNFTGSSWHPWQEPGRAPNCLTFGSFSKSLGIPGWRIGYLFGDAALLEQALKVQDSAVICPPTPSQLLVESSLRQRDWIEAKSAAVRRRLDLCREAMSTASGLEWREPGGGFFTLASLPEGMDDTAAAMRLLEEHSVATIPGSAFGPGGAGHLRVSFGCLSDEEIGPAMGALSEVRL
jgi:aminotransferase